MKAVVVTFPSTTTAQARTHHPVTQIDQYVLRIINLNLSAGLVIIAVMQKLNRLRAMPVSLMTVELDKHMTTRANPYLMKTS